MSTADATAIQPPEVRPTRRLRQAASWTFHQGARLIEQLPPDFFTRRTQAAVDFLLCAVAVFLACQLRFDFGVTIWMQPIMWAWVLILPFLRVASIWGLRGYDGIWRYFNMRDAVRLAYICIPTTVVLLVLRLWFYDKHWVAGVPLSVIFVEVILFVIMASGMRALRRFTFESARRAGVRRMRALVVGNDHTIFAALWQLYAFPNVDIVGFLTPERALHGHRIAGWPVLGPPEVLAKLLAMNRIDLVLVADANMGCIGATVETATELGVEVRLLPSAENVIRGQVHVTAQAKPELALDRVVSGSHHPRVVEAFRGRVVLVSGAGGSIGSEICRQVSQMPASVLVLFDQDENSIFEISGELAACGTRVRVAPVVGDIRDRAQLQQVFERYRPHVVLHAAAYKHVPVMEANPCEAVLNNVIGTREVADLAIRYGAERFLMISTDKAVKPTSVMGATKRVAEMLVQARAASNGHPAPQTRCACVRFGNVMGSRGSVVPIFLRQIAAGGPVTITDEAMTRYFMTIPEAVQLVLQAATAASDGNIYMLDMGDPIKVTRLAEKLIQMSGLRPYKDIQISFVGARPGEKIHEQLWHEDAVVNHAEFPRVFKVKAEIVAAEFHPALQRLEDAALRRQEAEVLQLLENMPIGYRRELKAAAAHA